MVKNFKRDLSLGQRGEMIVGRILADLDPAHKYFTTERNEQCYGDIKVYLPSGVKYLEVKTDSCISWTKNVLCEEEVYYDEIGESRPGFMYSPYEIFCVLSKESRTIYIIDFAVLKAHYKEGRYKRFTYSDQYSDTYLLPLEVIRRYKGMIAEIHF